MKRKILFPVVMILMSLFALTSVALARSQDAKPQGTLVDTVRQATKNYKDVAAAESAGYGLFHGCVSGPQVGAMGIHFVNGDLAEAWDAAHETPPSLMGQVFHYVSAPNRYRIPAFYELHVWAWKENPLGMFTDWNPKVSCENYTDRLASENATTHNSGH